MSKKCYMAYQDLIENWFRHFLFWVPLRGCRVCCASRCKVSSSYAPFLTSVKVRCRKTERLSTNWLWRRIPTFNAPCINRTDWGWNSFPQANNIRVVINRVERPLVLFWRCSLGRNNGHNNGQGLVCNGKIRTASCVQIKCSLEKKSSKKNELRKSVSK